jgi:aspartate racemase
MRTIGLIGGMSWESTTSYYQFINQGIKQRLGGLHSAKIILHSVNFAEIEQLQHLGRWDELAKILTNAAIGLEKAGVDCVAICTNTMHKVAANIESALDVPLLHIADATAKSVLNNHIRKVGLLGTKFTMEQDFYTARMQQAGIEVIIPNQLQRDLIHEVIYQQLCLGQIKLDSKLQFLSIIDELKQQGAEAIILGCTEIAMLINQDDTPTPLFDTTRLHAEYAVDFALS